MSQKLWRRKFHSFEFQTSKWTCQTLFKGCCCCLVTKLCPTFCNPKDCSMPGSPVLQSPRVCSSSVSIESVMLSNRLTLCSPPLWLSIFPSIKVFSDELALHIRWPKYWSFSNSPSNEYSRLISFRVDWFDLLAIQGTHKSLLQHHSWKASVLWQSTFFCV